jgi:Xaa-Pro aminopeptidase
MSTDRHAARRSKLNHLIRKRNLGPVLITNPRNVTYLTGFTGEDSCLLFGGGHLCLFSDSRFETQLRDECPEIPAEIRTSRMLMPDFLASQLPAFSLATLGIESSSMVVGVRDLLAERLKPIEVVSQPGLVEELRMIKDADEIAELRLAIRQAERGFDVMRSQLVLNQTERAAAHELEHAMRRFGALRAAFDPIVAVGDRAALPHYRAGLRRFDEAGFALVDWGAVSGLGYHSDLTRLLVTSKLPPKLHHVYGVVLKAQQAGIAAIRPGARCQDVDAAARKVIEQAGYAKQFGHGLGHGIGLDIHEGPRLSPISTDELKPGMTITVEPGIYLPGIGGVRIEDDILVTRDGCEVLSSVPKDAPTVVG